MKRHLLTLIAFLFVLITSMNSQSNFKLTQTDYVGALSCDPAQDWTVEGWTNFDPKNAIYPDPTDTVTLNGMVSTLPVPGEKDITTGTTLTLDPSKVYLLKGFVVVRSGAKLIIPAGTIIRAKGDLNASPKNYATINVERGGQIEITGTANNPVILTSANPIGQRERGDYGGLVLAGRSSHNLLNGTDNNNVQMEGFNNVTFDANLARFGGTDLIDNSGIVRYFRAEFGGEAFELNKEINGITLGAVGSGTEFHHIQVSYSGDDSYEWFGGTLNSHHLIAWKGTDDDFDTDNGYSGISQFGIGVRDSAYYDLTYSLPSGGSVSEGFESDNEATGTANVRPYTNAVFSNFTMIGPVPVGAKWSDMNSVTKAAFRRGARIRRNSSERILNSIFMGYRNMVMIDGDSCIHNTNFPAALALVTPSNPVDIKSKQVSFANNLIVNTTNAFNTPNDSTANGLVEVTRAAGSAAKLSAINSWVRQAGPLANNIDPVPFTTGTVLINPLSASTSPNFRPVVSTISPALGGSNINDNPTINSFNLIPTSYVGALDKDLTYDWTKEGWTNFDPKNAVYPDPTDTTTLNGMISTLPVPGEKNIDGGTTLTLDASKVYLLKGFVVVRNGAKLIIPAGTIIRAKGDLNASPKNYATINVERGGQIEITGTATNPVILTSANPIGQRERGDYGGLVLAGRSSHNLLNGTDNNNVQMEGYNNVTFDANLARFGGTDINDNSGIVRYFRAEFGGEAFELNKEINGITLGAVGSGTEFHHIQVSYSGDDSYEWFGGTLNSHHLIAWKGTDDDFDTDNGYSGISQFGIGVRDSAYYDLTYSLPSGGSVSEGFESDNEATGTANVRPYTNAVFSNYTMIGPVPVGSKWSDMNSVTRAAFRRGVRIRRNSSLRIVNSIFMGYRNMVMIDGDSCVRNTNFPGALALVSPNTPVDVKSHQISFANNLIVNTADAFNTPNDTTANGLIEVTRAAGSAAKLTALNSWARQGGPLANNIDPVLFKAGTVLTNPLSSSKTPDFRPVFSLTSPACQGANFKDNPVLDNLVSTHNEIENAKYAAVYPNPVSNGNLNFGHEVISYGIFDLSGRLISHGFNTDHANVNGITNGIYFIKMEGRMQKFIIQ